MNTNTLDREESLAIARTIIDQLGGGMFRLMTGCKDVVALSEGRGGVQFTIGRNSKGISIVKVELLPSDTYRVSFLKKYRGPMVVVELEDVYADQLQMVFEEQTGMCAYLTNPVVFE
ncbi:MAG: hypothetical protein ACO3FL_04395 [Ilumatobacteraceae bacterium]